MKVGVPDLVSNSYFPAVAAVELGFLHEEGVDGELELLFPVTDAASALRDGRLDFLAGAAHAPLYAFPEWQGAKLVAGLSRNMYWFLVVRADLDIDYGAVGALRNLDIGAAPGVGEGLRQLLIVSGVDLESSGICIAPVPGTGSESVSFGVTAAEALADGLIDAFWANGMGAEVAVRSGAGKILVDARRDGGVGASFTFPALSTTQRLIDDDSDTVAAMVRAVVRAQVALRTDPTLARVIGERLFPPMEAALISSLVEQDTPYYDATIDHEMVHDLNRFAQQSGLLAGDHAYDEVVAKQFVPLWNV